MLITRRQLPERERASKSKEKGFTLAELLMALAIGSILLSVAVPSYTNFVRNSRQTTAANELLSTLHFARQLAVTRNARITVCASSTGDACEANAWAAGWIAFGDEDGDRVVDAAETVEMRGMGADMLDMASDEFGTFLIYRPNGRVMVDNIRETSGAIVLCDDRGAAHARVVVVDPSGRPRVASAADMVVSCPS